MSNAPEKGWLLDASIAVKWFLPADKEPEADEARAIMGALSLKTTTLAYYEVGNALTIKGQMEPQRVMSSLRTITLVCGDPVDLTADDHEESARLAVEHGITFYDASYVAIANRLNRRVISADRDLLGPGLAVDLKTAAGA